MHSADVIKSHTFIYCPLHDVGKEHAVIRPTMALLLMQLKKVLGKGLGDLARDSGM